MSNRAHTSCERGSGDHDCDVRRESTSGVVSEEFRISIQNRAGIHHVCEGVHDVVA